jgi:hypothetical protein
VLLGNNVLVLKGGMTEGWWERLRRLGGSQCLGDGPTGLDPKYAYWEGS